MGRIAKNKGKRVGFGKKEICFSDLSKRRLKKRDGLSCKERSSSHIVLIVLLVTDFV